MRKIIALVAVVLTVSACTDPYGRVDPTLTTLAVGAGVLGAGALGYAAGQNSAGAYRPAPVYNYQMAPQPYNAWGRPVPYYGPYYR